MAPKKQQQQQAATAAPAPEEKTTTTTTSQQQKQGEVAVAPTAAPVEQAQASPLLDKPTLVVLSDGRQIIGHLIAFDASGSILLNNFVERKKINDTLSSQRAGIALSIPHAHIVSFYQREDDCPEMKEIIEKNEVLVKELQDKMEKAAAAASSKKTVKNDA